MSVLDFDRPLEIKLFSNPGEGEIWVPCRVLGKLKGPSSTYVLAYSTLNSSSENVYMCTPSENFKCTFLRNAKKKVKRSVVSYIRPDKVSTTLFCTVTDLTLQSQFEELYPKRKVLSWTEVEYEVDD